MAVTHRLPEHYDLLFDRDAIRDGVSRVGRGVDEWARALSLSGAGAIYAVPVLRGGLFFFADLVRELALSVEVAEVRAWAYLEAHNAVQRERVEIQMERLDLAGRAVLIVDDICDSGRTLAALTAQLHSHGAREVRSAVLIRRALDGSQQFTPDWSVFDYAGTEWLVGYGMDDKGGYRNLPGVYRMRGTGGASAADAERSE